MKTILLFLSALNANADSPKQREMANIARKLHRALGAYLQDCGAYPTTEQGLDALVHAPDRDPCSHWGPKPYLAKIPRDPWNHLLIYSSDGKRAEIQSMGRDGVDGGAGEDADLVFRTPLSSR